MQARELYINGKLIHLSDATRIGVTFQANNIGELQKRQGTFTNTFKVPIADSNLSELDWLHLMNSNTDLPYRRNTATYIEDGIEIVSEGEAIIKRSTVHGGSAYVEIDVVSGNVDLFRAIGSKIVGDYYTEEEIFEWNLENVFNSRDLSRYYTFPFIDWRTDIDTFFSTSTADVRYLLPACYIPELFSRIEADSGYTFTGAYLESEAHNNMIITPSDFTKSDTSLIEETILSSFTATNPNYLGNAEHMAGYGNSTITIPEGSGLVTLSMTPFHNTWDFGFFNLPYYPTNNEVATLRFTSDFYLAWYKLENYGTFESAQSRSATVVTRIKENGTVVAEVTSPIIQTKLDLDRYSTEAQLTLSVTSPEMTLTAGNEYYVEVAVTFEKHSNINSAASVYHTKSKFERIPSASIAFGNDIRFRDIFRMKAADVVKDILLKRGIIIQTNSYKKEVQFNYFQDVIDNKPNAYDWSEKIVERAYQMEYKFGQYGQRNNFVFQDSDQIPDGTGDFYFNIDDQTLPDEVDAVAVSHCATVQANRYLGYNIPNIDGVDNLWHWNKPGWRMLQMSLETTSFTTTFSDTVDTETSTDQIPFCKFEGFDTLVPEYYKALIDILTKAKVLNVVVDLDATDIQKLDFTIPVFIRRDDLEIDGYFYINEITNYKRGKTPVQLIRL